MKELIFGIKDIFNNDDKHGCLVQYDCEGYHIPAYQRGYKWNSEENGQVSILLDDLWGAFQRDSKKEYYLQYITVKRTEVLVGGKYSNYLEVIDGQQRLTTLSIILSVCALLLDKANVSTDKLHYAIRENFFSEHVYDIDVLATLVNQDWKTDFENTDNDKQDIYYLFTALKKSHSFFKKHKNSLLEFYEYLHSKVKLIVNSVEPHIQSETVFKNLNSNKVPLNEVELIKGLLLTKVGRAQIGGKEMSYRELMETRAALGRQWDEITAWTNRPEINTFYFNSKREQGMDSLLQLVAMSMDEDEYKPSSKKKDFPLFNYFNKHNNIQKLFQHLLNVTSSLIDWYGIPKYHNMIGFCRFVKGSNYNSLTFLKNCYLCIDKTELDQHLLETKETLMPDIDIQSLRYREHDNWIHAVLLHLNIFHGDNNIIFNFHEFVEQSWTLEHIFPQSPEGKGAVLNDEQKDAIVEMLGDSVTDEIKEVLAKPKREEHEKQMYYLALEESGILNSIGNMCLLTQPDNSSNGCGFFLEKRENILELLQTGSFVPKHTFDVFSKMIVGLQTNSLSTWTKADIEAHSIYITNIFESTSTL